jgi:hypothetical protein
VRSSIGGGSPSSYAGAEPGFDYRGARKIMANEWCIRFFSRGLNDIYLNIQSLAKYDNVTKYLCFSSFMNNNIFERCFVLSILHFLLFSTLWKYRIYIIYIRYNYTYQCYVWIELWQ